MQQVDLSNVISALDVICPMHVLVRADGTVDHLGRTIEKLLPADAIGRPVDDILTVKKPFAYSHFEDIEQIQGKKLRLQINDLKERSLVGVVMPVGQFYLFNLSFGISIASSIQKLNLQIDDFAVTDSAVEMMYLAEAKTAAMSEFKKLSIRLNGEKTKAEKEATTDALTGLLNVRALRAILASFLENKTDFAIMMIDLDFFKQVNDTLGHAAGDQVLKTMANILREETRREDIIARNGGDEFTVLLRGIKDLRSVEIVASRIIERIQAPINFGDSFCHVSASIGTMFFDGVIDVGVDDLLNSADTALYQSKRTGRGKNTISKAS